MKDRFENYLKQGPDAAEDTAVIERNSDTGTQEHIHEIQMSKEELVRSLQQWRGKFFGKSVENDLESQFGNRTLQKTESGYQTYLKGGQVVELTEGDVFAAAQWGTFWRFPDTSIDKHDQQKIMIHQMRNLIGQHYDEQLVAFGKVNKLSDDRKRDTYERIGDQSTELTELPDGLLAEKMILSVLHKVQRDFDLPFTVHSVDVYEDVENKIDFVVSLQDHRRGVKVSEQSSGIGVQFTLNASKAEDKQNQINASKNRGEADVDDIVLVSMPFVQIRDLFDSWRYNADGSRINEKSLDPRGPDYLMSNEMKLQLLKALLKKLPLDLTEDELHEKIISTPETKHALAA